MSVHLHSIDDATAPDMARKLETIFFVIQRANGSWSPAAKIMAVRETQDEAEAEAERLKQQHPQQVYGVAQLTAEARSPPKPVEIVRAE